MISGAELIEGAKRHIDRMERHPDVESLLVEFGIEPDALAQLSGWMSAGCPPEMLDTATTTPADAMHHGFCAGFCIGWDHAKDTT